ncbi:hypothetical protein SAMN05880582_102250 [Rhizobium sp. RU20A]|uniref:hypothetical protein n=1 Tax=Rhizobium sp. RU20A TaxID=1907412 RepID=UPI000954FCDE|nr:hypothetical protein [Rhizobium sp. RU20A]SIQ59838.1 hypothetical protein SAMN05880582_102250 [Rhizobium sp. RU20A]
MPILSIAIPLEHGEDPASEIVPLLKDAAADIEVLVGAMAGVDFPAPLAALAAEDARVKLITTDAAHRRMLWHATLSATSGEWICLIRPGDAIEPDLHVMVSYLKASHPQVDALGWNAFQIDPDAKPGKTNSVAIPAAYQINSFDKTAMLKAFFHWENSLNVPKMPFGLYHGAVRRSLLEGILAIPTTDAWQTPVPQYEWAAKALLFAEELAFCARPLSAINAVRYQPVEPEASEYFLFHSGLGITGAVAEVQFHVLRELSSPWQVGEAFVRACMIDCIMETDRQRFVAKGNAYFASLERFNGGALAHLFRPDFRGEQAPDLSRGLKDKILFVDRFLGGAQTAPAFFRVARAMMAPVGLICGGVTDAA